MAASLRIEVTLPSWENPRPCTMVRFATWPAYVAERGLRGPAENQEGYIALPHPAQPWTGTYATLPDQVKWYLDQNPVWIAFRDEDAASWITTQEWNRTLPHPLAARPVGSTVPFSAAFPDEDAANFLPTRLPEDLLRWSALNANGKPPEGAYG